MDGPKATPDASSTDLAFGYLASSLAQLLEVARRELEHDREAAKASLAAACNPRSNAIRARNSRERQGLPAGKSPGCGPLLTKIYIAAKPGSFLAVV
jgi:hypothetical protein